MSSAHNCHCSTTLKPLPTDLLFVFADMATQQVDSLLTDVSSSEAPIEQLPVKCGSASGILYLD